MTVTIETAYTINDDEGNEGKFVVQPDPNIEGLNTILEYIPGHDQDSQGRFKVFLSDEEVNAICTHLRMVVNERLDRVAGR